MCGETNIHMYVDDIWVLIRVYRDCYLLGMDKFLAVDTYQKHPYILTYIQV